MSLVGYKDKTISTVRVFEWFEQFKVGRTIVKIKERQ